MEKLHNNLLNDAMRGRQSSMYRAQRLAEYALYDGDPHLFNTELEQYLNVTAEEIRDAAAEYLLTDNYSLVEIVPSPEEAAEDGEAATPASLVAANSPEQPGAPPPQVPPRPSTTEPPTIEPPQPVEHTEPRPEKPQQPADAPLTKG